MLRICQAYLKAGIPHPRPSRGAMGLSNAISWGRGKELGWYPVWYPGIIILIMGLGNGSCGMGCIGYIGRRGVAYPPPGGFMIYPPAGCRQLERFKINIDSLFLLILRQDSCQVARKTSDLFLFIFSKYLTFGIQELILI